MFRRSTATLILLMTTSLGVQGQGQSNQVSEQQTKMLNLSAYAELLRSDIQAQKVAILTEVMGFTEAEDKAFWPIYRDYNAEMDALGNERVALIAEYARVYSQLSEEAAQSILSRALDLEKRRSATFERCVTRVRTALSPKMALKFLQVEHQLLLIVDLQIAASLPLVTRTGQ